jgi:hypothetical protein
MTLEKTIYNLRLSKAHYFNRFNKNLSLHKKVFVNDGVFRGWVTIVGDAKSLKCSDNKLINNESNNFYYDELGYSYSKKPKNCRFFNNKDILGFGK